MSAALVKAAEQFDVLVAALPVSETGEEAKMNNIAELQAENDTVGHELQRKLESAGECSFLSREREREMERNGAVMVESVGGRSTVTRSFSKYPLKFIIPKKVGSSKTDAVWIYCITYGGGIVSGDSISCDLIVKEDCTAVLTTQASTKVYKSKGSKCSYQFLEATVRSNALLAVIPDPVTCFAHGRYSQKQVFRIAANSNLLLVDWITSGRHESGEKWEFDLYKSTNCILTDDGHPLFVDTVLLEKGSTGCIADHMQDYHVIAMVIILGPMMKQIQNQVRESVRRIMVEQLHSSSTAFRDQIKRHSDLRFSKPSFVASSSVFGDKEIGLVVRIAAKTTESVYRFLQQQLAAMAPILGVAPYK